MKDAVPVLAREEAERAAAEAFRRAKGTATEVLVEWESSGSTRFSNNAITQNVSTSTEGATVRLVEGKRQGRAETATLDSAAIARAAERARAVLTCAHDDEQTLPLLEPPQEYHVVNAFSPRTAEIGPEERARMVDRIARRCRGEKLQGSGLITTKSQALSYANSTGILAYHCWTEASVSITAEGEGGVEGWAEVLKWDADRITLDEVLEEAVANALASRNPTDAEPGTYHVVLAPAAVSELMLFWTWLGSGAKSYQEGRSYLSGKMGQKLFSPVFTVWDDAYHLEAPGLPFDFEGVPRQKMLLVEKGVPCAVVHDRLTARREEVGSTGHSLPQPNTTGPLALNIVVEGGDKSTGDLVKSVNSGLLVNRFHYSNTLDPKKLSMTGMTRSGLFRIEGGEVAGPVKNMRFTDNLLSVFSALVEVGKAQPTGEALFGGGFVVPPMRIEEFKFTSGTEF